MYHVEITESEHFRCIPARLFPAVKVPSLMGYVVLGSWFSVAIVVGTVLEIQNGDKSYAFSSIFGHSAHASMAT